MDKATFDACLGHAAPALSHEPTARILSSITFPADAEYVGYLLNMVNSANIAFVDCITKGLGI